MNFRKALLLSILAVGLSADRADALSLGGARYGHTTTLLPDGNIMVAGGLQGTGGVTASSLEIYNMATNAWATGESIGGAGVPRSSHTATLMGNGKVLIAGGFNAGTPQSTAYVYDPVAHTWSGAIAMANGARAGHTATLINSGPHAGNVLICGGKSAAGDGSATNTCEIYISSSSQFVNKTAMSSRRVGHTATAITGGRVFVSGGRSNLGTYLPTNEIYNPELDQWQTASALLQGRAEHTAVVLNNGLIMIAGGYNSLHILTCKANAPITDDECWYIDRQLKGDNVAIRQNVNNQGFIAAAEFFDQNGGRVTLSGLDRGEAPYRFTRHASVLNPDGKHHTLGGYGNIPPTYFSDSPIISPGSTLDASATGDLTATIAGTSGITFPLKFALSRGVDGRLVDADIFISKPAGNPTPASITVGNASIYLNYSTAPADGSPVGKLISGEMNHGDFADDVTLDAPAGTVVFQPLTMDAPDTLAASGSFNFTPSPLQVAAVPLTGGALTMPVTLKLPIEFLNGTIAGKVKISGGTIEVISGAQSYRVTITGSAMAAFSATASGIDAEENKAVATDASVAFTTLTGTIDNSSGSITTGVSMPASTGVLGPRFYAEITSDLIDLSEAVLNMDISTAVVREMIFTDDLIYTPSENTWSINDNSFGVPIFNHGALVTPAADMVMTGGRNCGDYFGGDPDTECPAKVFTANRSDQGYVGVSDAEWRQLSKLKTKRAFHTATQLPDRRILVCGGSDGNEVLRSCEVMDPETKIWSYTDSMTSPRSKHTATLLPSGNVLVTGGAVNASTHVINTAEIFYPASNRWATTAEMATHRANHTATLLPTGNVLVAGGDSINGYATDTEIYFTTMAVWAQPVGGTKDLTTGRAQHTATLLKDGNVLVAGGVNGTGALSSYELFNSAAQSWSAPGNMLHRRYAHTATLLRDGRVLAIGGSDNEFSQNTFELYDGAGWDTYYLDPPANTVEMTLTNRTSHSSTLLPNGKVMILGGETAGSVYSLAQSYDPDFVDWSEQGELVNSMNHTTVVTSSGQIMAIGGWNGSGFLDAVQARYFSYDFDAQGFDPKDKRNPAITSGTAYFDRGSTVTLLSGTTNFHGFSEASGGGSGSANASFHNPRVYMQAVDFASGFMVDITSAIYRTGANPDWARTTSSITVMMPGSVPSLPYGYYHMRVAANGQFSHGHTVQVTVPRPCGVPDVPAPDLVSAFWRGTSSITWTWAWGTINNPTLCPNGSDVNGYAVYASSSGVFLDTVTFTSSVTYTQSGLSPNSQASISVTGYNMGGTGDLTYSATYFTLAVPPTGLRVNKSEFNSAALEWSPAGNADHTAYQVTMCPGANCFNNPVLVSTQIWFSGNYTSTAAVISGLDASVVYYFRVQAQNGKRPDYSVGMGGVKTGFSNEVSTLTVGSVTNIFGSALSTGTLSWTWKASTGPAITFGYSVYDLSVGSAPEYVTSGVTALTTASETHLSPNTPYKIRVHAIYTSGGSLNGPDADSPPIYTMAVAPTPCSSPDPITPSTNTITACWNLHGNPSTTTYRVSLSSVADYSLVSSVTVSGSTASFQTYSFLDLTPNIRYYSKVISINGDGRESDPADLGSIHTWVNPPASVAAPSVSMSGVTLTWDNNYNSGNTVYQVLGTTQVDNSNQCHYELGFSTYMPFQSGYKALSFSVNGLLTSTKYCFAVEAMNGDSVTSGPPGTASPLVTTVPGPDGAPTGSIGGTSDPNKNTTISGMLPTGRLVTMYIPAGSFPGATGIAISSSTANLCSQSISTISLRIYSENGAQPEVPVTLTFNYTAAEDAAAVNMGGNAPHIVLARYNPDSNECLPLETTLDLGNRLVTATLNHFSDFQLIVQPSVSTLNSARVYPNPFYTNRGNGYVTIEPLPANSKVRIYTLTGEKVWEGEGGTTGVIIWKGLNKAGEQVASGIYLAVIDSSAGKKIKKIAVER